MYKTSVILLGLFCALTFRITAQVDKSDWVGNEPDGCTSITCGRLATI